MYKSKARERENNRLFKIREAQGIREVYEKIQEKFGLERQEIAKLLQQFTYSEILDGEIENGKLVVREKIKYFRT